LIGVLAIGALTVPTARGQGGGPKQTIYEKLAMQVETKDFTNQMSFKEFLTLLHDLYRAKDQDIAFMVDVASFRDEQNDNVANPYDAQVQLPAIPKSMTAANVLRLALAQQPMPATFILRDGAVWIVSEKGARPEALLRQKVVAQFDRVPFTEAARQLSRLSGVSVLIDPRVKEKAQMPITAEFRGDVVTEAALRMIADMAELRIVLMDGGVYVTTAANAEAMEKQNPRRPSKAPDAP
jgi:hypothetical protein